MTTFAARGETLLSSKQPRRVAAVVLQIAPNEMSQIEAVLPDALEGNRPMVRAYVEAYRNVMSRVLDSVNESRPDLLVIDEASRGAVVVELKSSGKQKSAATHWLRAALEQEAMSAPFTDWVGTLGIGQGTAVAIVNMIRTLVPSVTPLTHLRHRRRPGWALDDQQVVRFYRAVLEEMQRSQAPLEHVAETMKLNKTELAGLLGVKRQALDQWRQRGVPSERQEQIATVAAITDLLLTKLKADRIPGVVRRPALAYGDRTILEAISAGDQREVLQELHSAFDWAAPV